MNLSPEPLTKTKLLRATSTPKNGAEASCVSHSRQSRQASWAGWVGWPLTPTPHWSRPPRGLPFERRAEAAE